MIQLGKCVPGVYKLFSAIIYGTVNVLFKTSLFSTSRLKHSFLANSVLLIIRNMFTPSTGICFVVYLNEANVGYLNFIKHVKLSTYMCIIATSDHFTISSFDGG